MNTIQVKGRDLKTGDVIQTFGGRYDRISDLRPNQGKLAYLWQGAGGARIAEFDVSMPCVIDPWQTYTVKSRV